MGWTSPCWFSDPVIASDCRSGTSAIAESSARRYFCAHCGSVRVTDTWAQDAHDGTQGHTRVSYEDAPDGWKRAITD